ncbi:hypothetical protein FRC09_005271 [Ceratobasidium sp. 395]|nr:hypothetical protein FRC09_005271 [Ceratobasidium sp. 395]
MRIVCRAASSHALRFLPQKTVIISSSAPRTEIIEHLTEHGCQDLTDDLDPTSVSVQPVSHGGYGSVYCEKLHDGRRVAIKALRVPFDDDDEIDKLPKVTMLA